jgi:HlyD family secretion protein
MDVSRAGFIERRRRRRWIFGACALVALVTVSVAVSRLKPAPISVERETVYFGTVERGSMLRQVWGHGTLVPIELRWIPAQTRGRVERVLLRPGARVEPGSVILELSNPEVERAALDAGQALVRAEAELASLRVMLGSQELDQEAQVALAEADFVEADLQARAERKLAEDGLLSDIQIRISAARAEALATRHRIALERLELSRESNEAQLEAKLAEVEQHRALAELRAAQRDALAVRAGMAGVVQEVAVEVGREVAPGANLALVADSSRLQAEVRIPATQAREVQLGQPAHVDTRNGIVDGVVSRIDPTVRQSTVLIDIELTGTLPQGARPDMSVEGRVDIELLEDVLFVDRPASGSPMSLVQLFRVEPDDEHAVRVPVRLGRASVRSIEIVEGLAEGDKIIISDIRHWDEHDRLRFK